MRQSGNLFSVKEMTKLPELNTTGDGDGYGYGYGDGSGWADSKCEDIC